MKVIRIKQIKEHGLENYGITDDGRIWSHVSYRFLQTKNGKIQLKSRVYTIDELLGKSEKLNSFEDNLQTIIALQKIIMLILVLLVLSVNYGNSLDSGCPIQENEKANELALGPSFNYTEYATIGADYVLTGVDYATAGANYVLTSISETGTVILEKTKSISGEILEKGTSLSNFGIEKTKSFFSTVNFTTNFKNGIYFSKVLFLTGIETSKNYFELGKNYFTNLF